MHNGLLNLVENCIELVEINISNRMKPMNMLAMLIVEMNNLEIYLCEV